MLSSEGEHSLLGDFHDFFKCCQKMWTHGFSGESKIYDRPRSRGGTENITVVIEEPSCRYHHFGLFLNYEPT